MVDSILHLQNLIFGPTDNPDFRRGPLSLQVAAGEIILVIGPNGSGKSTLLRTCAGVQDPITGSALSGSGTAVGDLPYGRRPLYVPAELPHDEWLRISDVFDLFEVTDHPGLNDTRFLRDLSSGERKRMFLDAALSSRAPLLILDEPDNFLDPRSALEWRARVLEASTSGRSFLISSHDLHWALSFTDARAVVLPPKGVEDAAIQVLPVRELIPSGVLAKTFSVEVTEGRGVVFRL